MADTDGFGVELVHALESRALAKIFRVTPPATAGDVLALAAADPDFADIPIAELAVGIFGQLIARDRILEPGDRLELYRPLAADPKEARRQRVQRARKETKARRSISRSGRS